ncbi:unnamed protein product [Pleuronectes platessa]|uniref:Uncharacterized protein n=1 Tax=Pleuronectes platessa TaxID=8262 RepID=A0A9N7TMM0_PLEPL|nr:unnamed protein product [Pleuronectes platessa]
MQKKQQLKQLLIEKLEEKGSLAGPSTADGEGEADLELRDPVPPITPIAADPSIMSGMSEEELRLTLHIREMEMRNQGLEVQAMHRKGASFSSPKSAAVLVRRDSGTTTSIKLKGVDPGGSLAPN